MLADVERTGRTAKAGARKISCVGDDQWRRSDFDTGRSWRYMLLVGTTTVPMRGRRGRNVVLDPVLILLLILDWILKKYPTHFLVPYPHPSASLS